MIYKVSDVKFQSIGPKEFENLCYDLLLKHEFYNLIWREGGPDNGRDIEANFDFINPLKKIETKWFFECKLYSNGVPPDALTSKIAWADACQPDYLVFFISSYLTNGARTWIEKIQHQKSYKVIVIEGEEIKNKLISYPALIELYFSQDRYEKLFTDIKDFHRKFNIRPSFELLKEIMDNLDLKKLDENDFGFILMSFYDQFQLFTARNDYCRRFYGNETYGVLKYLKEKIKNEELSTFEKYKNEYSYLGGFGFLDEIESGEIESGDEMKRYNFQIYELHLNNRKDESFWKLGNYLFIIYKEVAFELFIAEQTEIRIIKQFTPDKIDQISLTTPRNIVTDYIKYLKKTEKEDQV